MPSLRSCGLLSEQAARVFLRPFLALDVGQRQQPQIRPVAEPDPPLAPLRAVEEAFPLLGQVFGFDLLGVVGGAPVVDLMADPESVRVLEVVERRLEARQVVELHQRILRAERVDVAAETRDHVDQHAALAQGGERLQRAVLAGGAGVGELDERKALAERLAVGIVFRHIPCAVDPQLAFLLRLVLPIGGQGQFSVEPVEHRRAHFELLQERLGRLRQILCPSRRGQPESVGEPTGNQAEYDAETHMSLPNELRQPQASALAVIWPRHAHFGAIPLHLRRIVIVDRRIFLLVFDLVGSVGIFATGHADLHLMLGAAAAS